MKKRIIILSMFLAVIANSCKVTLVPNYDGAIATQIDNTLKIVDSFYLTMLETTKNKNNDRAYFHFINSYINIEIELQSLLDKNRVRPLNKNSIAICENTLKQFQKYKSQHKTDNQISDANIILNRMYMHDELVRMQMGEAFKPTN
ncbi:MAG: hypothetical protein ABIP35_09415 [Ginsengibacter sp.]